MKDQLAAACCGVYVLGQAFEANAPLLKSGQGGKRSGW
jgi:hypothetical protein